MNYPDLSDVRRILVAKLRHHGDVLLTSAMFSSLKKALPSAEIDAYIYRETHPMLDGHPAISNFILHEKKKPRLVNELKTLWKIRRGKYDLVINLTEGDRGAIAAKVSGARFAVGFDPEGSGMKGKAKMYSHLVKHGHHIRHTVEMQLDALRVLGIFPTPDERELFFHIPESDVIEEYRGYIVIHPVSRWMFKCWPAENVAEVIRHLQARGEKVVLTANSDPQEVEMVRTIQSMCDVEDLAGKISLKQLGAIIRDAKLLLTLDSLPLHLSSVFKTPVIAIFGPTSEKRWGPWRNPHAHVLYEELSCRPCYKPGCGSSGRSDCLETLPVKKVLQILKSSPKYDMRASLL